MKINSKKIVLSSLAVAALAFTGCGGGGGGDTTPPPPPPPVDTNRAVVLIPDNASFNVFSEGSASKFAGVQFFGNSNVKKLATVTSPATHLSALETYLTENAVSSDITGDVNGGATAVAVVIVGDAIADASNTDASRFTFENTARMDHKLADGTDWREGWAVDIDGKIIGTGTPIATPASAMTATTAGIACATIPAVTYQISTDHNSTFTEECTLSGLYTTDVTLTRDKLWALDGQVRFGGDNANNVTLTIEPGTVVTGKDGEFLLIARGSQIMAEGTKALPIIFTADQDVKNEAGFNPATSEMLWGGVAIAGNAPVNKAAEVTFEFSDTGDKFGGINDADDSGSMKYCVVKYSGFEVRPDEEVQGISLGGVGHGTTLEHISIHNSSDDGIEMWGGSVDVKYLSVTGADDDSIDTDNGYTGNFQYVYVEQHAGKGDRLLEADNDGGNYTNTRISHPKIANFTFIASGTRDFINWREGTRYSLVNGTISAKADNSRFVVLIPDRASFDVFSDATASKFAGVTFMGTNVSNLATVTSPADHKGDLETYLTTNAVSSDITNDLTGAATAEAVGDVNAHIADVNNADASRYTFENTARMDHKLADGTDWRSGWAVDINGVIIP